MVLYPIEGLYKVGVFLHQRLSRPKKLPCFVISIGNITTGGTGKTEYVLKVANMLLHRKICILTRGYKGKYENRMAIVNKDMEDAGDEALMIANRCSFPIIVGKNRKKTAQFAIDEFGADTVILDDGFQYYGLYYDLNILLINGTNPFGNYHLLPCGILREPISGIKRADVIIVTKKPPDKTLIEKIREYNKKSPIFEAYYEPENLIDDSGNIYPLSILSGKKVFAVSGIGDPFSFEETLKELGSYVFPMKFPDHHFFRKKDIKKIKEKAKDFDIIVSTLKDKQRLKGRVQCLFLVVSLKIKNEEEFAKLLP